MNVAAWVIRALHLKRVQRASRELRLMSYQDADQLLHQPGNAWRIAPEEDYNRKIGYVWLERPIKTEESNHV